jgi:hypothetical protein
LGAYTKAEDEAMDIAFDARGKRRLNKVFVVIGFFYPDYSFPTLKQETKRKITTTTSSTVSKPKRAKVFDSLAEAALFREDCCSACYRDDGDR